MTKKFALVPIAAALVGIGLPAHAQTWSYSFADRGVSYTFSDLTASPTSLTQRYSLVLNTTGYSGPVGAFLDSVNIRAWSGGSNNMSFSLLSAPAGTSWTPTEGPISSGPVGNTGCGGSGAGFACVEATTKGVLSVGLGAPYTFMFAVTGTSASQFLTSAFSTPAIEGHIGAGYANSAGRGAGYGITSHVMTPIPEPETYAMLLAGLGLMGFVAHRRQRKLAVA